MAALTTLAARQLDALPAFGAGETTDAVDLEASIARAVRHQDAIERVGSIMHAPDPSDRARYGTYVAMVIDRMAFANISGAEIVAVHARQTKSGVKNRLPAPWGLARLLVCLCYDQKVRDRLGAPLRFNSVYRAKDYNRAIGGASRSQHVACTARDRVGIGVGADVASAVRALHETDLSLAGQVIRLTTKQAAVLSTVASDYNLTGVFQTPAAGAPFSASGLGFTGTRFNATGGIGKYSGFVHHDLRGVATRWNG